MALESREGTSEPGCNFVGPASAQTDSVCLAEQVVLASHHSLLGRGHPAVALQQDQPPDYDLDSAHWTLLVLLPYHSAY